jgi:hypothetical protein
MWKLQDEKNEILEEELAICVGQLSARNGSGTDEVFKEKAKEIGQQRALYISHATLDVPLLETASRVITEN